MNKNPFTPTFGSEPLMFVGRERLVEDVIEGLENAVGDPNRATIFTGPRGSGKTVLLRKIEEEARKIGWISVSVMSIQGMLEEIIEQVYRKAGEFLEIKSDSKLTSVTVGGIGISRTIEPSQKGSWRIRMDKVLDELDANKIGLLITVDELDPKLDELISLIANFQLFKGEQREVALIMAGLPNNVYQLFQDKSISFLRRAFHKKIGPIRTSDVKRSIQQTIEMSERHITAQALEDAASATDGYPFLIQLIGYHVWRQSAKKEIDIEDVVLGIAVAREDMEEMILDSTLRGLSEHDIEFLIAMSQDDGNSKISDIARRMGTTAKYAGQYRLRLIDQGIISSAGRGSLTVVIPMLKELIRNRYEASDAHQYLKD
jgi:hypothetical protein